MCYSSIPLKLFIYNIFITKVTLLFSDVFSSLIFLLLFHIIWPYFFYSATMISTSNYSFYFLPRQFALVVWLILLPFLIKKIVGLETITIVVLKKFAASQVWYLNVILCEISWIGPLLPEQCHTTLLLLYFSR